MEEADDETNVVIEPAEIDSSEQPPREDSVVVEGDKEDEVDDSEDVVNVDLKEDVVQSIAEDTEPETKTNIEDNISEPKDEIKIEEKELVDIYDKEDVKEADSTRDLAEPDEESNKDDEEEEPAEKGELTEHVEESYKEDEQNINEKPAEVEEETVDKENTELTEGADADAELTDEVEKPAEVKEETVEKENTELTEGDDAELTDEVEKPAEVEEETVEKENTELTEGDDADAEPTDEVEKPAEVEEETVEKENTELTEGDDADAEPTDEVEKPAEVEEETVENENTELTEGDDTAENLISVEDTEKASEPLEDSNNEDSQIPDPSLEVSGEASATTERLNESDEQIVDGLKTEVTESGEQVKDDQPNSTADVPIKEIEEASPLEDDEQTNQVGMEEIGGGDGEPKETTDVGSEVPLIGDQPHPTMVTGAEETLFTEASVTTKDQSDCTATVKLIIVPSGQVVTMALSLGTTPEGIRDVISKELKVPPVFIQVLFNGRVIDDRFNIESLGIEANDTVAFEIASTDPENHPLKSVNQTKQVDMPDVIMVRIPFDDGQVKDTIVEIERTSRKKAFIGGYRHKKTGKEYHHGTSQTYAPARPPPTVERNSRDTQTTQQQHQVQQTFNSTSTQMTKPGVFVSNLTDKFVVPRKYETADQYKMRMLMKVVIIQTYYRRWLAKRKVNKLRKIRDKCESYEEEVEIQKRKDKEDRIQREFERRMNPKSKEDFDLLYGALEKWRQEEMTRINGTLTGAERKAAMCLLLEQETELIAAIDRHQLDAASENKDKTIQRLLGRAAASKKWKTEKGYTLKMDTAYTLRGKELLDIYNSLNMKYLTQDERLDVLLTLKHTVKEHDCKLTHEIIELIDREADLLMRGVKEDNLNGLRKRLTTLFLQYCKTPTFNPEITNLLKVPQDSSSLRQDIHFCNSCGRYLQATAFNLGIKSTGMGRCRTCLRKDNLARVRQDLSAYKHLLQKLRKQEEAYQDGARIAFLIEEADLRYLVENTWESMSILSSWDDLADLEMVRWRVEEEWSPWNAVLFTRDEVEAHQKVTNLTEAYGDMLAHRVSQKHVLAKNYFSKLAKMAEKMKTKRHKVGEPLEAAASVEN